MKKFLFMFGLVTLLGLATAKAGDPVSVMAWPNSSYDISQSTMQISSTTVATIAAVSGYRAFYVSNLANTGTTIYYRIDGSTASIPTVGWPIRPTVDEKIETNGVISLQLAAGATAVDVRTKTIKK